VETARAIAVASKTAPDYQVITPATVVQPGVKKVAVIMINFQNDQSQPVTADDLRKTIFTNTDSVKQYYLEDSFFVVEGLSTSGASEHHAPLRNQKPPARV
jgi:hypothetical protein